MERNYIYKDTTKKTLKMNEILANVRIVQIGLEIYKTYKVF